MRIYDINSLSDFKQITLGEDSEISGIYCCDLLSMALGKLKQNQIFITVIANINTLAVAYQKKVSCIIIAENVSYDNEFLSIAKKYDITIFKTNLSSFEAAIKLNGLL